MTLVQYDVEIYGALNVSFFSKFLHFYCSSFKKDKEYNNYRKIIWVQNLIFCIILMIFILIDTVFLVKKQISQKKSQIERDSITIQPVFVSYPRNIKNLFILKIAPKSFQEIIIPTESNEIDKNDYIIK